MLKDDIFLSSLVIIFLFQCTVINVLRFTSLRFLNSLCFICSFHSLKIFHMQHIIIIIITLLTQIFSTEQFVCLALFLCHLFDHDKSNFVPIFVENKKTTFIVNLLQRTRIHKLNNLEYLFYLLKYWCIQF